MEHNTLMTATSRDQWLLKMRSDGRDYVLDPVESNDPEKFEMTSIRPIIDFQMMIILAQFRHFIKKFKPVFNAYKRKVQTNYVDDVLHTDKRIRNSMIASVVGMMTISEYETYAGMKNEANRRIIKVLIDKVSERVEELY